MRIIIRIMAWHQSQEGVGTDQLGVYARLGIRLGGGGGGHSPWFGYPLQMEFQKSCAWL